MEESEQKLKCVTVTITAVVGSESRGNAELTSKLSRVETRNFYPHRLVFLEDIKFPGISRFSCAEQELLNPGENLQAKKQRARDLSLEAPP